MKLLLTPFLLLMCFLGFSQTPKSLESYGPVYDIENADYKTNLNQEFKAVFDVASISDYEDQPNRKFVTIARFLRLHQAAELENNSVKATLVVHGSAIFDLLNHKEYAIYHEEKNSQNPNYELLSILSEHNVDIILCGQTAAHRSIDRSKLHPDVKIELSAMTALSRLQNEGYALIQF
ncbi:DsrE family protein [Psychroflexus sp. CAK1W]|uniref:DsrE family protein n=1 Tax=Psychroflexus curvus TaxID=2873595 RepID=UPI001CCF8A5D|nr:DsrE family protein [Psychroflexus curvus]MBZ9628489.1 DsrE family protein [Psychroflexus curvus]